MMRILLSLSGLWVLVALASPCCLPDSLSFKWTLDGNTTSILAGQPTQRHAFHTNGSGAYDLYLQKFIADQPAWGNKIYLDLIRQPGRFINFMKLNSAAGRRTYCHQEDVKGMIGLVWQCIFDNGGIFTPIRGSQNYRLNVPNIITGVVTVKQQTEKQGDFCEPMGAETQLEVLTTGGKVIVDARLGITNQVERFDASVFRAPCKATGPGRPPQKEVFEMPTPDELIEIFRRRQGITQPQAGHA